jgi:mannose-1-phosphate guanylyltransferase / mannose-6-phosphate isomerase
MITPIILCGGAGTRLWPLSRQSYPKQFVPLIGQDTLFQATAARLKGPEFADPLIVTQSDFRFIATQQLAEVGITPSAVLIEPCARNTGPAVLAACLFALQTDPDALLLIAPSDHAIPDGAAFRSAVQRGAAAATAGQIVTFGITPTRPETGYGYLEMTAPPDGSGAAITLSRFVEKPDAARAAEMLAEGRFLWNAGIFLARADTLQDAFTAHAADVIAPVKAAIAAAKPDLGFLRLDPDAWASAPDISIDYAVMERAGNLVAVPFDGTWSDMGGWDAVWAGMDKDASGTATSPHASAIDCHNTLLKSASDGVEIVGIGLTNIIAVAMSDAVLIADMSRAQDVKSAVTLLKSKNIPQAITFPKDHRPWGWFQSLALGPRFQVKQIHVNPGAALSLQSHHHRAEHWIVVSGTAEITIDDTTSLVTENQSVYIPITAKHRLKNPGKIPITLIEVQTGTYLKEDDIIRYQDIYQRG